MFEFGVVDEPVTGSEKGVARTQDHLDLTQTLAEEGIVLLKNTNATLPIDVLKYKTIGVFGIDGTNASQVSENHGGFVIDKTLVTSSPLEEIIKHGKEQNISVSYSEAYPGTGTFPQVQSNMFLDGLNVTYWTTANWTGPVKPNSQSREHYFLVHIRRNCGSMASRQGDGLLYVEEKLIANMSRANFGNTVQGIANLTAGNPVLPFTKVFDGLFNFLCAYGITLGVSVGNITRYVDADTLAASVDLSIIFVSDRFSEGTDNGLGLSLREIKMQSFKDWQDYPRKAWFFEH
ncbi:hypothetical protein EYC84_005005 [Monilinia fructicola]|uniref:beta-glucosidase n=1 Tax=Monilinia fructicola TaxID=38448 RepID=A0A5M9JZ48_MONFR|nr:hypothetical protein EYC84_005005 [Monilinia fructicola]